MRLHIREATKVDLASITTIYNQGIEEGNATLEVDLKTASDMDQWFSEHDQRYQVLVATLNKKICGWASLNRYSQRRAHEGIAVISIYIERDWRGKGLGGRILKELEWIAINHDFHKLVLYALPTNKRGYQLYKKNGFREVGVFQKHGRLNGNFIDVIAMEKILID
ncbi:phosphinothricin acetyltransferase [Seinonella peptonophila]|uniref:Phosphinothricin acetyltransferase n=1 Tax=Seinonella peptonophila TaxID=112248 RepID=A0A1M4SR46_9BACL|nr:arsinothricin resistance N-acetyltransferase ArsN1 family A [Seinonella peptonophila]SHE34724.1 phosphinothricin acetyltransferase [Seinonella peptonophila]